MDQYQMSCLYYPTTVIIVDDNKSFLEKIQFKIGKNALCQTYSDPEEALNHIQQTLPKRNHILKDVIGIDMESDYYSHLSGQLPLQYDVSKIYEHTYNKDRFNEASLVIVDYEMPTMNGEKFCKKLKELKSEPIKIILLTGEADDPIAIRLFNAGMIDKFLRKAQPGLDKDLKKAITEMQKKYFYDLTYPITQALTADKDSSLGDPTFIKFFNKICQNTSATSYYLIELSGSFIFINDEGSPTWLIIKTFDELKEIAAQMEDLNLPKNLVESVRKGEMIPYFGSSEDDFYSDATKFKNHLYKAERLMGEKDYCYSLTDSLAGFSLNRNKILSLNEYISNI